VDPAQAKAPAALPLIAQRNVILVLLLVLAAAAWGLLAWHAMDPGMAMGMAASSPSMGLGAPLFLVIWVTMMVAMMFPTAAPMILAFNRVQADRRHRGRAFVPTWVFVAGYMVVWTLAGLAAYLGALAAEEAAAHSALSATTAARIGGAILIAAGLYQLTPLKDICLSKCRTPFGFIMTSWRDGMLGALRMGLVHGGWCLGCCWLLFVILFPLGIMNIAAMAAITVVIFAEKPLPWGRCAARTMAVVLVVYGAVVIATPEALPTFPGGGMATSVGIGIKMPM
jgi:predicted metal-binding membrane protein